MALDKLPDRKQGNKEATHMEVAFRSLDCGVLKGETGTRCCCRNAFREKNLVPDLKDILLVYVEGCKFSPSRGSRPHEGKKRRTMFVELMGW